MKYTFLEILTHGAAKRGMKQFADAASQVQTAMKNQANYLYELIWFYKQYGFSGDKLQFTTIPPYTTGTISGTAGEKTITGSSTSWPAAQSGVALRGQWVLINDKLYRIAQRVSTTSLILETALVETLAAGTTYAIYFIEYPVRMDYGAYRDGVIGTKPLVYIPEAITPTDNDLGEPEIIYNAGVTDADFGSFTGNLNVGSTSLTNVSGVTVDDNLIGMSLTVNTVRDIYYIIGASGTTLTLDRAYQGSANLSSATFLVNPRGTPLVGLKPYPTTRQIVRINYTFTPNRLVGDNDYTLLPSDIPMLVGMELLGTDWKEMGEGNMNEVLFADRRFKESLKTLNFRGTPMQRRMLNMTDLQNRNTRINRYPGQR